MRAPGTWLLLPLLAGVALARAENPSRGENKERSAVQTRCLQECLWLREQPGYSEEKIRRLEQACVDRALVDRALAAEPPADWGETKSQAIEVCLPQGERAFLDDLRCPGGEAPNYRRSGNVGSRHPYPNEQKLDVEKLMDLTAPVGAGEADLHIVDRYEVRCGDSVRQVFFDMYHCGTPKPWRAPRGFTRPLR